MKKVNHRKKRPTARSKGTASTDNVPSNTGSESSSEWISNEFSVTPDDYRRMEARRRLELRRDEALLRAQIEDFF